MSSRTRSSRSAAPATSTAAPGFFRRPAFWWCALVFLAVFIVYHPALHGDFLWDDDGHVTRPDLRSWGGLARIWFEVGATQQYYPLLHSAFWLEHHLWGDAAFGYHLLNVLLHASAACLFAILLRRLSVPGAWLAALFFALHPVCVESVAWISEQKNTLSTVLYLSAALAYLRFDRRRAGMASAPAPGSSRSPAPASAGAWRHYGLATALFLLALLTKTVTATLPAALLVLAWWRRGRLEWRRDVLPLAPWCVLGAACGLFTAHFERVLIGANGADFNFSLIDRFLLAGHVFWFYLGKLAWPAGLIFIYPRWTIDPAQPGQWLFPIATVALAAVAVIAAWRWPRWGRGGLAALLLFGGTLFPVSGFFNVYPFIFSFVADHFQYLATMPVFALAAAGLTTVAARLLPGGAGLTEAVRRSVAGRGLWLAATALLLVLATLSRRQAAMYRDVFTLYETTLARNPDAWLAHTNLAMALTEAGRPAEAIPHLQRVLQLRPDSAIAENNLGDDLLRLGRAGEAVSHLERAIRLQPGYAVAHNNLGVALVDLDRPAEAIPHYEQALRILPDYAVAERNLGVALATAGRTAEAIPHFQRAVALSPGFADAERSWAVALMLTGRFEEAVPHFSRAIALDPGSVDGHATFGRALATQGRLAEAEAQYRAALEIAPDSADAHRELAEVLRRAGRMDEAREHYLTARRLGAGK